MAAGSAPAWVANNATQTSTLYDGNGKPQPQPAASQLIVNLAAGANGAFNPTGIVANSSTTDFVVTAATKSGSSAFIFDGEGGMIAGWSPSVDRTHAVTVYTDPNGAVYKGLAIAKNAGALFLYATDFHNNKIDVFDTHFAKQATSATAFAFTDPAIPAGYAPFGIQAINNGASGATQIYVTYAQQVAPDNHVNATGAGLGYVDIYDTNGVLIKQLIAGGALNAPWGLALAPADFGTFSNALLVGNSGDGKINAYDAAGRYLDGHVERCEQYGPSLSGPSRDCVRQRREQSAAQHAVLCRRHQRGRRWYLRAHRSWLHTAGAQCAPGGHLDGAHGHAGGHGGLERNGGRSAANRQNGFQGQRHASSARQPRRHSQFSGTARRLPMDKSASRQPRPTRMATSAVRAPA